MTPWLALSLGLWLGQTPGTAPSLPADATVQDPTALQLQEAWEQALANGDITSADTGPGVGGSGTEGTSDGTQATAANGSPSGSPANTRQEVEQLRAQVRSLQAQLAAQQEQSAANAQNLQQQLSSVQERSATIQARAQELERQRQQRLAELERARSWMVAADQALEVGDLAIGDALGEADSALDQVMQSASISGNGQTVTLIEDARSLIAQALESTGHRDTLQARDYLFAADWRVREARRQNLDAPSATLVNNQ